MAARLSAGIGALPGRAVPAGLVFSLILRFGIDAFFAYDESVDADSAVFECRSQLREALFDDGLCRLFIGDDLGAQGSVFYRHLDVNPAQGFRHEFQTDVTAPASERPLYRFDDLL